MELNKNGTEKRTPKTFKCESSIYKEFADILKNSSKICPSSWIREQIINYINENKKPQE